MSIQDYQLMSLKDWQEKIRAWAIRKEWRGPNAEPRLPEVDIALIHSEISEALEELRKNADPGHTYYSYDLTYQGMKFKNLTLEEYINLEGYNPDTRGNHKPEGFGPELADAIIRILDTAEEHGLDMDYEVARKMEYNETREIRHGGKLL